MNTIWYTYLGDLEAEELDLETTDVAQDVKVETLGNDRQVIISRG